MRIVLLLCLLFLSRVAFSSPAEGRPVRTFPLLDTAKEIFGTRVNLAADKLDSFFATDRADDEFGRSQLRLRSSFFLNDKEISESKTQYRMNLKLPSLEKRFRPEYYETEAEKKAREEKKLLREEKREPRWIFNSDVSASVAIPPKLIIRSRVRNNFRTGTIQHFFKQQLTYTTDASGFVTETTLDSDHTFNEDFIFRFINKFEWEITPKIYTTNHGPTWLYQASDDDAFNYGFITHSIIDGGPWHVDNHNLFLTYRRNLYQQWVYLDITHGLNFPKKWDFVPCPYLNFQFEMIFGGD